MDVDSSAPKKKNPDDLSEYKLDEYDNDVKTEGLYIAFKSL